MYQNLLELLAKENAKQLVQNMPKHQLKAFLNQPEEKLDEIILKVFDIVEKEIKNQFVKAVKYELKQRSE